MIRQDIYNLLFDRLNMIPDFVTASPYLRFWRDVPAEMQPALFLSVGREHARTITGLPTLWRLQAQIVLYAKIDPDTQAAETLNPLIDLVVNTLNGFGPIDHLDHHVHAARVQGAIERDEIAIHAQAAARIPIEIIVA